MTMPANPAISVDTAASLAALRKACADPALPGGLRATLQQAHDALLVASAASTAERNRYRALFDAVPDPVSVIAWDGTALDLNRAGIAAYQRPREQIVGQPIEVLNPDLPRDHMRPVQDALSRGRSYVVEVTNMRADGTRFPVEVHSANFEYDGQPAIVAVARDLSSRAEAELRYRELMEVIDKGILVRNTQGRITYANPAALRMLEVEPGLTVDEELRPPRWRVFDEHGREILEQDLPSFQALRSGDIAASTVLGFYNVRLRKLTWLSVTSVPQFAPGADRPAQVLSLFTDVTALKRDSTLFDRVQDLAHIGGWEWNAGPDEVHLTIEAQRALGVADPVVTMQAMQAPLREHERRRLQDALQRTLEAGEPFELELQGIGPDGHPTWLRILGEAEQGVPVGARVTGTLQDVTSRKQAEETLRVQARSDPLTGLLNRDAVLGELQARLQDRSQAGVAVL